MEVTELLELTNLLAERNNLSKVYVVGGVPRDRFLGKIKEPTQIKDIDLTTGNKDSIVLASIIDQKVPSAKLRDYDDGHCSIDISGLRMDFSNHFLIPNIEIILKNMGVVEIDDMKKEAYSRDFTINTLMEDLNFKNIYDITGNGIKDLKNGIIKCPIDPKYSIGHDPRRILRALKMCVKYNFEIDHDLQKVLKDKYETVLSLPKKFVQDKVQEIVALNPDKGIDLLIEYKLLPIVPLSKSVSDTLIKKRQLARAL